MGDKRKRGEFRLPTQKEEIIAAVIVGLVLLLLVVLLWQPVSTSMLTWQAENRECQQYRDTPAGEIPGRCLAHLKGYGR